MTFSFFVRCEEPVFIEKVAAEIQREKDPPQIAVGKSDAVVFCRQNALFLKKPDQLRVQVAARPALAHRLGKGELREIVFKVDRRPFASGAVCRDLLVYPVVYSVDDLGDVGIVDVNGFRLVIKAVDGFVQPEAELFYFYSAVKETELLVNVFLFQKEPDQRVAPAEGDYGVVKIVFQLKNVSYDDLFVKKLFLVARFCVITDTASPGLQLRNNAAAVCEDRNDVSRGIELFTELHRQVALQETDLLLKALPSEKLDDLAFALIPAVFAPDVTDRDQKHRRAKHHAVIAVLSGSDVEFFVGEELLENRKPF